MSAWLSGATNLGTQPAPMLSKCFRSLCRTSHLSAGFKEDQAHKLVRNAGDREGLEAWSKLSNESDPITNTRRQTILALVPNPLGAKMPKAWDQLQKTA